MSDHQNQAAETIANSLMQQGGDPINCAQVAALAVGKIATHARLEPEVYQRFVKELAQALIHEAGLSKTETLNKH